MVTFRAKLEVYCIPSCRIYLEKPQHQCWSHNELYHAKTNITSMQRYGLFHIQSRLNWKAFPSLGYLLSAPLGTETSSLHPSLYCCVSLCARPHLCAPVSPLCLDALSAWGLQRSGGGARTSMH